MIKALAKLGDGTTLIMLGLSAANIAELKRDRPILFNLNDIGLSNQAVCIGWKHDDGKVAAAEGFDGILICLTTSLLDSLPKTVIDTGPIGLYRFCLFAGETEQAMERMLAGLCGSETKVSHSGYAPSDMPLSSN